MRNLIRILVTALAAPVALATIAAPAPAGAESVTIHDPTGDADGYDITRIRVRHKAERVAFELRQENTPYWYEIRLDTPGPKSFPYIVVWSVYGRRDVGVYTRHAWEHGGDALCRRKADVANDNSVVTFAFPRSCISRPNAMRVKAIAWDDQFGWKDRTGWSEWAGVA